MFFLPPMIQGTWAADEPNDAGRSAWYRRSVVNIHFDNHSSLLGQGQTVDQLVEALRTVPVTMIQVSAQSNGYATYPTRVGLNNPAANGYDTLGSFKEVARRLNLKLCIYMSVDRRPLELKDHPEWAAIGPDGKPVIVGDPIVCQRPNREKKGYLYERFLPQIREIIQNYDPDGFWFDGDYILTRPCWCERCLREWKAETGEEAPRDPKAENWNRWVDWHYRRYQEYRRLVAETIHQASPKALYTSNWSWAWTPEPVPDFVDTLSGDSWQMSQVICTVTRWGSQQKTAWDIMSYATPESRCLARRHSLQRTLQEGALTLAAGGTWFAWTFSGGKVPPWGIEVTRLMANFARDREPALGPSLSASPVAVLDPETSWRMSNTGSTDRPVFDTARSLLEARYMTDLVNEETYRQGLVPYQVIVVPEGRMVAPETFTCLMRFVEKGGLLILLGEALRGEDEEESAATAALLGIRRSSRGDTKPAAVVLGGQRHVLGGTWSAELAGARVLASFPDGRPALTINTVGEGSAAYLAASKVPYPDGGLWAAVLRELGKGPSYAVHGVGDAPVVCSLRRKGNSLVLHVTDLTTRVNGVPADIDSLEYTDWNPPLRNVSVVLPLGKQPHALRAVPPLTGATASYADGLLTITVDMLQTHAAVIMEVDGETSAGLLPPDKAGPVACFHPESERGGVVFADSFENVNTGQQPGAPWVPEVKGETAIVVTEETSAGLGSKCVKMVDAPESSFWPFLHRSVFPFTRGRARLSFDLRVDQGAICLVEVRYEGKGPGPSVRFDGETGTIVAAGRELAKLPIGLWTHVVIEFTLGSEAPSYTLTVSAPDQPAQTFAGLPYASEWFFRCDSIYFVGVGTKRASFYLDNVVFERLGKE